MKRLNILYVGNFASRNDPLGECPNAEYISESFRELGHRVKGIHEREADAEQIVSELSKEKYDFLLTEEARLKGDFNNLGEKDELKGLFQEVMNRTDIPIVAWLTNIFWGIMRREEHIKFNPIFKADIVFSTDGGHDKEFKEAGVNHVCLRQGIYQKEAVLGKPIFPTKAEIGFVGSLYDHIWPYRRELIEFLQKTYGERFQQFGQRGEVRHIELNNLLATLKIVIGDSVWSPYYWSNRIYEMIGRGGFLITAMVPGLEREFKPYKHFIPYQLGDFQGLKEKIDYYIKNGEEREIIRLEGFEYCKKYHTYFNRVKRMLEVLEERGIIMTKPTQDLEFWRKRLKEAKTPVEAIGVGFDWQFLDSTHKKVVLDNIDLSKDKVLDVACGVGRTANWFKDENYTGIDFVPEFIDIARRNYQKKKFFVCDITKLPLPFKDNEFDWAVLISVKVVIAPVIGGDKWSEVERELRRVCRNVLIMEYGNNDPREIEKSMEILRYDERAMEKVS